MALTIAQIAAVSYDAVLTAARTPANQWAENPVLDTMESMGMIEHKAFGNQLEETLDYRANAGTDFQSTDLEPFSLVKTEVLTAAKYDIAELRVPVVWSNKDEVQNPSENQKVALVKYLFTNGIKSHDDMIEQKLFAAAAYNGFNTIPVLIPTTGQGVVGGVSAVTETMWRNQTGTYLADGSDIEAQLTTLYNSCAKGSSSSMPPKLMVSGATPHALFESTQQPYQRWASGEDLKAGFKKLWFKTAIYIFSQYGGTSIFMTPGVDGLKLAVSKQYFRDKSDTQPLEDRTGSRFYIYSALQLVTKNKSRLGVLSAA